jgi:hypothetical protein
MHGKSGVREDRVTHIKPPPLQIMRKNNAFIVQKRGGDGVRFSRVSGHLRVCCLVVFLGRRLCSIPPYDLLMEVSFPRVVSKATEVVSG